MSILPVCHTAPVTEQEDGTAAAGCLIPEKRAEKCRYRFSLALRKTGTDKASQGAPGRRALQMQRHFLKFDFPAPANFLVDRARRLRYNK